MAHFPSPNGSYAKPSRGPGFIHLFFMQPVVVGEIPGIVGFETPHCTRPLNTLWPAPTLRSCEVELAPVTSKGKNVGAAAGLKAFSENPNSLSSFSWYRP